MNGGWSEWNDWAKVIDEVMIMRRQRVCNKPTPAHGGKKCIGKNGEEIFPVEEEVVELTDKGIPER